MPEVGLLTAAIPFTDLKTALARWICGRLTGPLRRFSKLGGLTGCLRRQIHVAPEFHPSLLFFRVFGVSLPCGEGSIHAVVISSVILGRAQFDKDRTAFLAGMNNDATCPAGHVIFSDF